MTTAINQRRIHTQLTRATMFFLLAFVGMLYSAHETRAQWVTNGNNINNTNAGNVGVGTAAPEVKLAVGGAGTNVYATDAWVENNAHVQGNEAMTQGGGRGRMRIGTAWGYMGLYAETSSNGANNDLIFGSSSGLVRIGPGGSTQSLIVPNGNFGVGTAAPAVKLSIGGGGANVYATDAWVENNAHVQGNEAMKQGGGRGRMRIGTAWGYMGLYAETTSTGANNDLVLGSSAGMVRVGPGQGIQQNLVVPSGKVGVGTTEPATALHVVGDVTVTGNISAKYQDVAEWVPSREKLAVGTVVVVDAKGVNQVLASSSAYDTSVAGVITGQPGLILGEGGEGKVKVATTGRVKVKVDATRFPIRAGDLLVTSSVAGVAMRSEPVSVGGISMHRPGTLIGKALESLETGAGEILVLLSLQ